MSHNEPKKILFLFRELAGYFVACLEKYASVKNIDITVVYWPVNSEAPFQWDESHSKIQWIDRRSWNYQETIERNQSGDFDLIVVSGWGDVLYNKVIQSGGKAKKVVTFDTQWDGSWRMRLGRWWLWWKVLRHFDAAWIPGDRQRLFAEKLFFNPVQIVTGFYVADTTGINRAQDSSVDAVFRIGIVARLVESKGFPDAVLALIPSLNQNRTWQLHIWGTGPLREQMPQHPQIFYHGFAQPETLKNVWREWNVFLLPSKYEPWGVVVHEAAAAGLPLILSSAVGAGDHFVQSPSNGFIFPVGDYATMITQLSKIDQWNVSERKKCETASLALAASISQSQWIENLEMLRNR